MHKEFEGKNIIVTGSGSGIGRATALAFAEQGANLLLVDINAEGNAETRVLADEFDVKTFAVNCDVSKEDQVEMMVKSAVSELGGIDVAVNNAGVEQAVTMLVDQTVDAYNHVFDVNVKGLWLCMRYELQHMLKNGGGAIVNTSAMADSVGAPGLQFYVASKHAVLGLTRSVALETIKQGVRINAVAPGPVLTAMVEAHFAANPGAKEMAVQTNPSGRLGETKEIADAILYLASGRSSFMVGQSINVDGGATVT